MTVQLEISESVVSSLKLSEAEVEPRLRLELALSLYAQDILSFGKAVELAGISRYEFGAILGKREIPRHYTEEDLALDLRYAHRQ